MEIITKGYLSLFITVTDTIKELEEIKQQLMQCQQTVEALYIEDEPVALNNNA